MRARGAPQLPHGWVAHRDEQTGQIYYCYENGHCQWEFPEQHGGVMSAPDEETAAYIAQKLQEPQIRIPRAVVEFLGTATALELLAQTEQVQAERTSGDGERKCGSYLPCSGSKVTLYLIPFSRYLPQLVL